MFSHKQLWNFYLLLIFIIAIASHIVLLRRLPKADDTENILLPQKKLHVLEQRGGGTADHLSHSLVHCVGDNFLFHSAWLYRSCQYRNLCWNDGEWVLYRDSDDPSSPLDPMYHPKNDNDDNSDDYRGGAVYARSSTTFNSTFLTVSATGATPYSAREKKYVWSPKVKRKSSFSSTKQKSIQQHDMVVIPILITPGGDKKSTMLLLMDTLFPIFNLVTMFGWESSSNNNDNITIVPLDPENCVDTEDSSSNCKRLKEYIEKWMGYRFLVLDNTNATSSSSSSFCASHGAAGIGMLTATGLSRRGHHVKDFSKIRNTGRGPLLWDFTRLILKNQFHTIRHRTAASTATMMTVVQVAVEQQSNDMLHSTTNISFLCESLKQSLDLATTSIHDVLIADDDTTDNDTILSIAANSNIWIATAKDEYNTWPAMFLPRDSTLILLYDETQQVTVGKQRQQKRPPVMQDFDVWNHMSHLKVHWLSLQNNNHDNSSQGNHHLVKEITRLIQMETTIKESSAIPDRKGGSPDGRTGYLMGKPYI